MDVKTELMRLLGIEFWLPNNVMISTKLRMHTFEVRTTQSYVDTSVVPITSVGMNGEWLIIKGFFKW